MPGLTSPRTLAEIIAAAMPADCGECWPGSGCPCSCAPGVHVARLYRAERRGLISGRELHAVVNELVVFTLATVAGAEAVPVG